ncbi:MAG: preprotein translocase subunit SecE [Myxococcales bacterium]|nr:MAG: preprotein translocase subunit SecE [Myxococcales bacterium]
MNDESNSNESVEAVGTRTMGLERYVQFAFLVFAIGMFWFVDNFVNTVWAYFAEPDQKLISGIAAVVGMVGAFLLYRNQKVKGLSDDVAQELARVTWPTRKETRYASLVVVITSIVAAVLLGLMDAAWSALTDFIYTGSIPLG